MVGTTFMRGTRPLNRHVDLAKRASATSRRASDWPSFSIVIPTFQRRDVVCDAARALAATRYRGKIELIVIVDGSTDGTADALRAIDMPFPVNVVEQPNGGASAARNRGAALARSDILLFLDDDMIAEPDLIEQHARLHREGANAVIGNAPIHPGSPAGFLPESVARWIASTKVNSPLSPFDIFSGQLSVRRSIFEKLGGFDTAFTTAAAFGNEDADFGVRLLAAGDVRHNPAAISRQLYVVSAREFMERARRAVAADLLFVRKHPQLARQLFDVQEYPDLREYPEGPPEQPYDAAGWTLPLQMGVNVIEVRSPLTADTRSAFRPVRAKPSDWCRPCSSHRSWRWSPSPHTQAPLPPSRFCSNVC